MSEMWTVGAALQVAGSATVAALAHLRGRSGWKWGLGSLLVSPVLAGVVLLFAGRRG